MLKNLYYSYVIFSFVLRVIFYFLFLMSEILCINFAAIKKNLFASFLIYEYKKICYSLIHYFAYIGKFPIGPIAFKKLNINLIQRNGRNRKFICFPSSNISFLIILNFFKRFLAYQGGGGYYEH